MQAKAQYRKAHNEALKAEEWYKKADQDSSMTKAEVEKVRKCLRAENCFLSYSTSMSPSTTCDCVFMFHVYLTSLSNKYAVRALHRGRRRWSCATGSARRRSRTTLRSSHPPMGSKPNSTSNSRHNASTCVSPVCYPLLFSLASFDRAVKCNAAQRSAVHCGAVYTTVQYSTVD